MIISMIVVVRLVVVDDVALGGGGGGGTTPIESICPAKAETASAKQRIATAHVWRRVFIKVASIERCKKICMKREILHQARRAQVFLQECGRCA